MMKHIPNNQTLVHRLEASSGSLVAFAQMVLAGRGAGPPARHVQPRNLLPPRTRRAEGTCAGRGLVPEGAVLVLCAEVNKKVEVVEEGVVSRRASWGAQRCCLRSN